MADADSASTLLGSWRLLSWEHRSEDGDIDYPMGDDAVGFIHYLAGGRMAVAIMTAQRARFAGDDLLGGSQAEKADALATFIAYCGRFEVHGGVVAHEVEVSSFPNWTGTRQERLMKLQGDRLMLSTAPLLLGGRMQTAHLIWERM